MAEPEVLYHYTEVKTLEKILASRKLWATYPPEGDDPWELRHGATALVRLVAELETVDNCTELLQIFSHTLGLVSLQGLAVYVVSFSGTASNKESWNRYAVTGSGVSIGFRWQQGNTVTEISPCIAQVVYGEPVLQEFARVLINGVVDKLQNPTLDPHERVAIVNAAIPDLYQVIMSFKRVEGDAHEDWESQDEWRAILLSVDDKHIRSVNGRTFVEVPFDDDPASNLGLSIAEIVLGTDCAMSVEAVEVLLSTNGFDTSSISVYHVTL